MERYSLEVEAREKIGKGAARSLRRSGLIPGVIYGKSLAPQPLVIDPKKMQNKLGSNAIFDLIIAGDKEEKKEIAMIKEVQKDPIQGDLMHIDFLSVSMNEKINVSVSVNLFGEAPGVKLGGVLEQILREIEIECLPTNIPEELKLDISNLDLGDSLLVSDIEVPENIDIVTPLKELVVKIVVPTELTTEETEETEEGEFAEPEVVAEKGSDKKA